MAEPLRPYLDSSASASDGAALAGRMRREGYLFLRGLVPRAPILELRRQFLAVAGEAGWLRRGRPADEATAEPAAACAAIPNPNIWRCCAASTRSRRSTGFPIIPPYSGFWSACSAGRFWCIR